MKTREQKQKDLEALAEQFRGAQTAMFVGFKNMTVPKDQELRNTLRQAGAEYSVVKNTLARKAAEGTPYAAAAEHFKGVTAIAVSKDKDPVTLSKAVAKFAKDNPEVFTFKAGVVEGKVVALRDIEAIASLPSKEVLISKIMFLINCQAQRLVTVLSAVPRNLAIVVKQIGDQKGGGEEVAQ
jgi:large subunit ribosomal protein L10